MAPAHRGDLLIYSGQQLVLLTGDDERFEGDCKANSLTGVSRWGHHSQVSSERIAADQAIDAQRAPEVVPAQPTGTYRLKLDLLAAEQLPEHLARLRGVLAEGDHVLRNVLHPAGEVRLAERRHLHQRVEVLTLPRQGLLALGLGRKPGPDVVRRKRAVRQCVDQPVHALLNLTQFPLDLQALGGVLLTRVRQAVVFLLLPTETVGVRRTLPPRLELLARIAAAAALVGAGVALGAPFIVFGQLVLVFLDMRRRLARMDRRLRCWELFAERGQESRLSERLRPR